MNVDKLKHRVLRTLESIIVLVAFGDKKQFSSGIIMIYVRLSIIFIVDHLQAFSSSKH